MTWLEIEIMLKNWIELNRWRKFNSKGRRKKSKFGNPLKKNLKLIVNAKLKKNQDESNFRNKKEGCQHFYERKWRKQKEHEIFFWLKGQKANNIDTLRKYAKKNGTKLN